MASWAPELPDPNAGDDLAYAEAWENRVDRTCSRCGVDRGALYEAHDSKGEPIGLFCELCVLDIRADA